MKFREGNTVEVLRREHDPCGSWFPGNIISLDGDGYMVRYKLLKDHEGEQVEEKVNGKDVRPQPPHEKGKRWTVGDIAEVFDGRCWRVGKVAKVLKNSQFVIRLFGSIQLKEFRESNLRIRQVWHNNEWSVIGKARVAQNKRFANKFTRNNLQHSQNLVSRDRLQVKVEDLRSGEKDGHEIKDWHGLVEMFPPARTINRSNAYQPEPSSKDLLIGGRQRERKSSPCAGGCNRSLRRTLPWSKQVDDISSSKLKLDEKFIKGSTEMDAQIEKGTTDWLHTCSRSIQSCEDSNHCSVASYSFNDFADSPGQNSHKSLENVSDNCDAESTFHSSSRKKHSPLPLGQNFKVGIHELELHAYKSTVQALYASGPLSWEQESLLTNLRLSLHISDEEHLLQLRHLLSSQVL